ncbi:putative C-type lectin domain family 20 member A [Hemibagrus wyckioides]|uniref:putative C-type lectin domain family 20 member A n=1 Tax=Hemibagrus wyckioides TaxID=337641 RepID=UPI00266D6ADB|nr:putative C-type lectin domain family 20 member A [Hemibagrus wyckioides]XP_058261800.1 putative C-type lectin domain family 20 member A [Hemibagrus wyckioides]
MEKHLFMILFLTGVLSAPRRYYLIQQAMTWNSAQTYCRANHDDLAIIDNADNLIRFQSEVQRQQFSSKAWVGMYNDINSWRWSLDNHPIGPALWAAMWAQPNNGAGDEICGGVDSYGWLDASCSLLLPVVCFDARYTGTDCYIYIATKMTWPGAQSYCRQYHTDLASTRNQTELSNVQSKIPTFSWIGLFRDFWKWADGTNFSTIAWMPKKPDNALGHQDCGYIFNNQACDAQCTNSLPFFCYSFITDKKQNLKLKVMSSQDVNDPAAQASILDKIKQKLKDHGMTDNIRVWWRQQADGLVFHKEK